ncbi:MAG: hypothetical protein JXQ87_12850 [Bacteroidia bacterium]
MENKKPTHFLMLFCYGEHYWTQLTVLSFLSAQCRLNDDIAKFRTVVVTDKPRYVKAYFGSWVEIINIDKTKLQELTKKRNGHLLFKLGLIGDFVGARGAKVLSLESDVYWEQSPLVGFNALDKSEMVIGKEQAIGFDKAVLGVAPNHLSQLMESITAIENSSVKVDDILIDQEKVQTHEQGNYFHYRNEMNERVPQIEKFFGRYYYREMGELYSMANLWTPDKWHLEEKDLPEELL